MVKFSNDVDILKYEPILFSELYLPGQVLTSGTGGTLSGTTFTATGENFTAASVIAGCVVYLQSADGSLDGAYEIVSVDSATQLTVSVVRDDSEGSAIAPPAGTSVSYRVSTFWPQISEASFQLTAYFGIGPGNSASPYDAEDILDIEVLKLSCVFAVLSSVYAMLGSQAKDDNFWKKSKYYQKLFEKARERCRLSIDSGSDGVADITITGSSVKLIRD